MALISTSGIAPNQQIKSEHLLRVINALRGDVIDVNIFISGSVTASHFVGDGSGLTNLPIPSGSSGSTDTFAVLSGQTITFPDSQSIVVPTTDTFIPKVGTSGSGNVTGDVKFDVFQGIRFNSSNNNDSASRGDYTALGRFDSLRYQMYDNKPLRLLWEDNGNSSSLDLNAENEGIVSNKDFSNISSSNKLIYTQRIYVDNAISESISNMTGSAVNTFSTLSSRTITFPDNQTIEVPLEPIPAFNDNTNTSSLRLDNALGYNYNIQSGSTPNTNTSFLLSTAKVVNGHARVLINVPTQPTFPTGVEQEGGQIFQSNTDMYMIVWSKGTATTDVVYYFVPKAIQSGSSSSPTVNEITEYGLTGSLDGSNVVFQVGNNFLTGSLNIWRNGILQFLGDDYTETGVKEITFAVSETPQSSNKLIAKYKY